MSTDRHVGFSRLSLLTAVCIVGAVAATMVVDIPKLEAG
jgi:hypothetical protein